MPAFHYVYILVSEDKKHHYVGLTQELKKRFSKHNSGGVPHTDRHAPWKIQTAIAFDSREKAATYETYLKSHAGREYAKRHF